jgi:hypothetical protein
MISELGFQFLIFQKVIELNFAHLFIITHSSSVIVLTAIEFVGQVDYYDRS